MKAAEWIDRVKSARGWDSDYRVAKELGITRSAISKYRAHPVTIDEETAIKVAQALGVDAAGIIIDQVAERSKSPEVSAALHELANQRLYIMLSLVAAALSKAAEALPALALPLAGPRRVRLA